ncbi:MAG: hypothetical protein PHH21_02590 [Candidatus Pacebacteria bacterium]|nr:hypothetical protein [Candidatus Paceibacterota bacterium]
MLIEPEERKYVEGLSGLHIGKAIQGAYRDNASLDVKQKMLTVLAERGSISLYLGDVRTRGVNSNWVDAARVDEFFRACCVFRRCTSDIPKEFIIGRIATGKPIFLRINGEFDRLIL